MNYFSPFVYAPRVDAGRRGGFSARSGGEEEGGEVGRRDTSVGSGMWLVCQSVFYTSQTGIHETMYCMYIPVCWSNGIET